MRTDISVNRFGWLYRLDYKKLLIIVFLLRLILASAYDILITVTDNDFLLPDSKFYSVRGRYVDLVLQGYDKKSFSRDMLPSDRVGKEIFFNILRQEDGSLPSFKNQGNTYSFILGSLYYVFGYVTIWGRIFNIFLSIFSVYLLAWVARRYFGDVTANLFLLIALFLPTQFGYSIMLCRDFLRVFVVSVMIWIIYGGYAWARK